MSAIGGGQYSPPCPTVGSLGAGATGAAAWAEPPCAGVICVCALLSAAGAAGASLAASPCAMKVAIAGSAWPRWRITRQATGPVRPMIGNEPRKRAARPEQGGQRKRHEKCDELLDDHATRRAEPRGGGTLLPITFDRVWLSQHHGSADCSAHNAFPSGQLHFSADVRVSTERGCSQMICLHGDTVIFVESLASGRCRVALLPNSKSQDFRS